jgi:uncharacterized YigZ family protein
VHLKSNFDIDKYYTIENLAEAEIKIKGSRFISCAFSANSKEKAMNFVEQIRAKHYSATHNCFAYQIGWDCTEFRYSDDGEPSGSAGKPILLAIKKFEISDVIVVVTRYFGGTKLGVGGLIRAYSDSAEEVLSKCIKKEINRTVTVRVNCRYEEISVIKRILSEFAISFDEDYNEKIEIFAKIPISKTNVFIQKIRASTNTKATAQPID